MRKLILIGLLLITGPALAEKIYVGPAWGKNCVGQKVSRNQFTYFLSEEHKCELPIVNAQHMKALYVKAPVTEYSPGSMEFKGCWGRTLSEDALLIYSDGRTESIPLLVFAEADFDKSGDAVVTKSLAQERGMSECR